MSPSGNPLPEAVRTVAGADGVRATIVSHMGPAGLVASFCSILFAHSRQRAARNQPAGSESVRELFGEDVVEHCVHCADVEPAAVEAAVTDRELRRGVERA